MKALLSTVEQNSEALVLKVIILFKFECKWQLAFWHGSSYGMLWVLGAAPESVAALLQCRTRPCQRVSSSSHAFPGRAR